MRLTVTMGLTEDEAATGVSHTFALPSGESVTLTPEAATFAVEFIGNVPAWPTAIEPPKPE